LQEAEEECCDARVVAALPDAAGAYASALVETVAFLSLTRALSPVGASGAGQIPLLKRRLTMILTADPARKPSRTAFWAVVGLGALLLPLAPGAAQTERPVNDSEAPPPPAGREPNSPAQPGRAEEVSGFKPQSDGRLRARIINDHVAATCASCHDLKAVHPDDLQRKPQTWREAHDDAIRLWDEVRRLQAQLRETQTPLPAATEHNRAEQIEKLQDEIELLKVQVRLREAHLDAAKADLVAAEHSVQRMRGAASGAVPLSEMSKAESAMIAQKAQVRIREAELQEPLVRLKQAERRLARLQPRPPEKAAGGREQQEKRLQELENKVNQLIEEMRSLQRELRRQKPADPPPPVKVPS
jgi:hypothetical protein